MEQRIPVIILAGFLGAGKTTALNHILRHSNGQKIGVIVNDFGEVNIDALLVSKQTENTMELSGGCICCQMSDGGLDETLQTFAHPGSTIDAILIEASGIAEPSDLRKLVLYSSNKHISMNGVVYFVDAANIRQQLVDHPDIAHHIAAADLLVLNKIDLVSAAALTHIEQLLRTHNPEAIITRTTNGAVSPELLFDAHHTKSNEQLSLAAAEADHHHNHLHDAFTSISFTTEQPLSPQRFEHFLTTLPSSVYRLKGILYYGMKGFEQKIVIHKVGNHLQQAAEEWRGYETPGTRLVAIGVAIDEPALRQALEACIDPTPDDISADDMVDIMRLKGF
ncbi:MAG: GTP-binding protein [Candidatus Saccharibacteria bacterium]|nr:GTP-binding protein [Candidatus Saccharibacteria bacterium]